MALDMNDPKDKEAVQALIDEAVEGLKSTNAQMKAEIRKLKAKSDVDPTEHQAALDRIAELEGKLTENGKRLKALETEAGTQKKAYETEAQYVQRLLVDQGLTDALMKAGVTNAVRLKAAKAMLASQVTIKTENDTRTAVVGDKPLADFVTEWANGDEGKYFAEATQNAGGGAAGGEGQNAPNLGDIKDPAARLAAINEAEAGKTQ